MRQEEMRKSHFERELMPLARPISIGYPFHSVD